MLGPATQRNCSSVLLCLGCWNGQMVGSLHVACCVFCLTGASVATFEPSIFAPSYVALTLTYWARSVFHFTNMDEPAGVSVINHSFLFLFRLNTHTAFKI